MIFYFSATGNSKYVAERIARETNDTAVSIQNFSGETYQVLNNELQIGIISPTYAWGIPSVLQDFLQKTTLAAGQLTYFFYVATYGTTPGRSGHIADEELYKRSGRHFDAFFSVKMPDTWTPWFDLSNAEKVKKINDRAEKEIDSVIDQIELRVKNTAMAGETPGFTRAVYPAYYDQMRRTNLFSVSDECVGCGLCAKKCPVQAIEIKNEKPVWVKEQCAMCLGCLHRCPKFAIQYGKNTKKHGQYINPNTKI